MQKYIFPMLYGRLQNQMNAIFSVEKVLYEDGSRYFCEVKMKSGKW